MNMTSLRLMTFAFLLSIPCLSIYAKEPSRRKSRQFEFHYSVKLNELKQHKKLQLWIPLPLSNSLQQVRTVSQKSSVETAVHVERKHGNRILYLEADASTPRPITVDLVFRVQRHEARVSTIRPKSLESSSRKLYLKPNVKVPTKGLPIPLLNDVTLPRGEMQLARTLYDVVDGHMTYDKSKPGYGQGDAAWACQSGSGNCTDFHSLFISLARGQQMPARFTIGFPLPPKRGKGTIPGYHCWAHFYADKKWIPVDISEADKHPEMKSYYFGNLTENRVAFTVGRDLVLAPRQSGPPLNYFIYPYVEGDGKPVDAKSITRTFEWRDVQGNKGH